MNKLFVKYAGLMLIVISFVSMLSCAAEKTREQIIRELWTAPREYPQTHSDTQRVDIINGYRVADPYRWMETEGAADDWVKAQNSYTDTYLYNYYYDGLEESIRKYFNIGFITSLTVAGGRYFYLKRDDAELEQPNLMLLSGDVERVLIDLNAIDPEKKTSLDWFYPSRDGRLLAYGLSKNGSEDSVLHIMDVNSNRILDDIIPNTRHTSLEWLPDKSGFFYTRYPEGDRYNRRAYFHKIGTDWQSDELIFGEKRNPTDWTSLRLSQEGDMLAVVEYHGWTDCDLYVYDLLTKRLRYLYYDLGAMLNGLEVRGGKIYSLTNMNAPKWKLVSIPTVPAEPGDWQTVIPEGDWPVEFFQIVKDRIVVNRLENVAAKLEVYDMKGQALGNVALPTFGMIDGFAGESESNLIAYSFTSFFYPSTVYKADLENVSGGEIASQLTLKITSDIQPEDYVVQQSQYPSYDGTMVNIFIIHKNRIVLDGDNPTLLYGYGGFQQSMTPYFSRRAMTWLERGGVYAVAGIRGGGEYGEDWHQAGMLDRKFQVFKDFEYAMRFLHKQGYTRPERLAIEGGSNGGLLVGAMVTSVPYLFAAGVGSVGLYDMIRYHKFPPGELWTGEYGSADNYTDTGFLLGYSPYHQIIKGVKYPAVYGHTADTDTRVHWVHTAKFIAALQAASASNAPILFHRDSGAGHGMGKGKSDAAREYIMKMTFLFSIIGDPAQKAQADSDIIR